MSSRRYRLKIMCTKTCWDSWWLGGRHVVQLFECFLSLWSQTYYIALWVSILYTNRSLRLADVDHRSHCACWSLKGNRQRNFVDWTPISFECWRWAISTEYDGSPHHHIISYDEVFKQVNDWNVSKFRSEKLKYGIPSKSLWVWAVQRRHDFMLRGSVRLSEN